MFANMNILSYSTWTGVAAMSRERTMMPPKTWPLDVENDIAICFLLSLPSNHPDSCNISNIPYNYTHKLYYIWLVIYSIKHKIKIKIKTRNYQNKREIMFQIMKKNWYIDKWVKKMNTSNLSIEATVLGLWIITDETEP